MTSTKNKLLYLVMKAFYQACSWSWVSQIIFWYLLTERRIQTPTKTWRSSWEILSGPEMSSQDLQEQKNTGEWPQPGVNICEGMCYTLVSRTFGKMRFMIREKSLEHLPGSKMQPGFHSAHPSLPFSRVRILEWMKEQCRGLSIAKGCWD